MGKMMIQKYLTVTYKGTQYVRWCVISIEEFKYDDNDISKYL